MNIPKVCPDCKQPFTWYEQPRFDGRPPIQMAECRNPACDLYYATMDAQMWQMVTPEQLESYRVTVRVIKARGAA